MLQSVACLLEDGLAVYCVYEGRLCRFDPTFAPLDEREIRLRLLCQVVVVHSVEHNGPPVCLVLLGLGRSQSARSLFVVVVFVFVFRFLFGLVLHRYADRVRLDEGRGDVGHLLVD